MVPKNYLKKESFTHDHQLKTQQLDLFTRSHFKNIRYRYSTTGARKAPKNNRTDNVMRVTRTPKGTSNRHSTLSCANNHIRPSSIPPLLYYFI